MTLQGSVDRCLATAALAAVAILGAVLGAIIAVAPPETDGDRQRLAIMSFGCLLALGISLGIAWLALHRRLVRPLARLASEADSAAVAATAPTMDAGRYGWVAGAAKAVLGLMRRLSAANEERQAAVASATAASEADKHRLGVILSELSEGLIAASSDHRIVLYNQAAHAILQPTGEVGLERNLFSLIAGEPVRHTLELLSIAESRDGSRHGAGDAIPFVSATADGRRLLRLRMKSLSAADGVPGGYVLTLSEATRELASAERREAVLRGAIEGLRSPVANLRAAAETLAAYPDMEPERRSALEQVVRAESDVLARRIAFLEHDRHDLAVERWPMADIFSADLFNCLIRRLADAGGCAVTMVGMPLWFKADSFALLLALEALIGLLRRATGAAAFDIESLLADRRIYIDLTWRGQAIAAGTLAGWRDTALGEAATGPTVGQVLDRHGSEMWSREARPGTAFLRLSVPAPDRPQFVPRAEALPPRPEFYDFALPDRRPATNGATALRDLLCVAVDTETTGLSPSAGDEIVAIGAVRIVKGRVLTGETFARLVNPSRPIPPSSTRFHGITDAMVADKPPLAVVLPQLKRFVADAVLVGHNVGFDLKFFELKEADCGVRFDNPFIDTMLISHYLYGSAVDHGLDAIGERLGIGIRARHTAVGDALATAAIFVRQIDLLEARGVTSLEALLRVSAMVFRVQANKASF
jgi:DNA polymerase-3 subunit epsilon